MDQLSHIVKRVANRNDLSIGKIDSEIFEQRKLETSFGICIKTDIYF